MEYEGVYLSILLQTLYFIKILLKFVNLTQKINLVSKSEHFSNVIDHL